MDIGVSNSPPSYHVDPAATARKAEALGFESIWCAEHPLLPASSVSPFPGSPDGVIPESYAHFADPFIALARASAATSHLEHETATADSESWLGVVVLTEPDDVDPGGEQRPQARLVLRRRTHRGHDLGPAASRRSRQAQRHRERSPWELSPSFFTDISHFSLMAR